VLTLSGVCMVTISSTLSLMINLEATPIVLVGSLSVSKTLVLSGTFLPYFSMKNSPPKPLPTVGET